MAVAPRAPRFAGRVFILIDARTASTAEIVAAALQRERRATLIGERTAGEVLNAELIPLTENVMLLVPVADVLSPDGRRLEGVGVAPDEEAADALACAMALADGASNACVR